jgi:VanZ family protein
METMNFPRLVRWTAGFACLIFLAGLLVGGAQPQAVGLIPAPWDKLAHAASFGLLAAMVELAVRPRAWLFFALPLAASTVDEIHQVFLPGRYASLEDWLAGAAGVSLAWWFLRHTRLRDLITVLRG